MCPPDMEKSYLADFTAKMIIMILKKLTVGRETLKEAIQGG